MEKTFEELIEEKFNPKIYSGFQPSGMADKVIKELLQQVREATIAEAVNYCVSQDWIKTIDNLKNIPTDRILDFENPRKQ